MELKLDKFEAAKVLRSPKVSLSRINELEFMATRRIKGALSRHAKPCLGYSMGKDSIVVQNIMRKHGLLVDEIIWATTHVQYMANVDWYKRQDIDSSRWVDIPRPSFEDLNNTELLFPATKKLETQWMSYKWKEQQRILEGEGYDLFITGRRTREHNKCGSRESGYLVAGKHYDTLSPIAEWTFDDIISYILYNNIELPPSYFYPYGLSHGSGAWAERVRHSDFSEYSINDCFDEVFSVEPDTIREAAEHLTAAKKYLEVRELI